MKRSTVLVAVLALAACAGGRLPATHYYALRAPGEIPAGGRSPEAGQGLVVGVRSFAVDPPYDQDRLVYRLDPAATEFGFYSYHRWAAPLDRLLSVAVAEGLRGTVGISLIEPAVSDGEYSASLGGRLLYLEEIDAPGDRQVRIALELVLRGGDGEILWSDTLAAAAATEADSVDEIVVALRQTLDQVLEAARVEIGSVLE